MHDYVIVFGGGVRPDGTPSGTLRHRIDGAIAWAENDPSAMIMPTGGIGKHGPAEAIVVRCALLGAGVKPARVVLEPTGRDTLESVRCCDALLREPAIAGISLSARARITSHDARRCSDSSATRSSWLTSPTAWTA